AVANRFPNSSVFGLWRAQLTEAELIDEQIPAHGTEMNRESGRGVALNHLDWEAVLDPEVGHRGDRHIPCIEPGGPRGRVLDHLKPHDFGPIGHHPMDDHDDIHAWSHRNNLLHLLRPVALQ
ncbi:TPA: hypothetical protein DCZ32_02470, partial [Candidatus Uhrbacteria bacterium]|nr:hypothetical protein [Candidatus Uhrbacteria bacterium]